MADEGREHPFADLIAQREYKAEHPRPLTAGSAFGAVFFGILAAAFVLAVIVTIALS